MLTRNQMHCGIFSVGILIGLLQTVPASGSVNFSDATILKTGKGPAAAVEADLRGLGRSDLVVVNNGSAEVTVYLNDGKGKFKLTSYPTPRAPETAVVSDLNGDGIQDVAVTDSGGVTIFLGNGDGTFGAGQTFPATPPNQQLIPDPVGLGVGDLNGDGFPDLIVTDQLNNTV